MLAHRIPYPPHTGDKTRAFHIAGHLARRHDLDAGFLVDDRADLDGLGALREVVPDVEFARLWKPWSLLKGLAGLALGGSLSLPYFRSRALRRRADARGAAEAPLRSRLRSPPLRWRSTRAALGVPVVMDFVDVDSDKWRQYAEHSRPPRSWLYRTEGRRLQAAEADDRPLGESVRARDLGGGGPAALFCAVGPDRGDPNGIDARRTTSPSSGRAAASGGHIHRRHGLPAQHRRGPATSATTILPRVRPGGSRDAVLHRRAQSARGGPAPGDIAGVVVTGTVPDVRPYYGRASVCVAPLRIGRGVQNKVLQAMAMGMPVVASSVAQRGLQAVPGTAPPRGGRPRRHSPSAWSWLLRRPRPPRRWGGGGAPSSSRTTPGTASCSRLEEHAPTLAGAGAERRADPRMSVAVPFRRSPGALGVMGGLRARAGRAGRGSACARWPGR